MGREIGVACVCGSFRATIREASEKTDTHAVCYCVDCRAFARHLGQEARVLDASGGSELYQVQPWQVEIREGREHLKVLQLAPKGLYRWYAACCDTPVCNTIGTPKIPVASFVAANLDAPPDTLGPLVVRYKPDQATGPVPDDRGSTLRFAYRTARNGLRSRLSGKWRQTPFFDVETGRSVVKPHVLTAEERAAAYDAPDAAET